MSLLSEKLSVPSSFDEAISHSPSTVASMECPCTVIEGVFNDRLPYASGIWTVLFGMRLRVSLRSQFEGVDYA